ncbi:Guanine deaminase [Calidithermus terrae]|uniref:Guanine deaminase n=1 Tax=Calidithermus terrae TaxID=1408545 RepID=A0A399EB44_9DEIN|nr:nucleoside deaminase [Calidithermus terrae]RIH81158.1 Guanine deaminase [Calidithermus terrae]
MTAKDLEFLRQAVEVARRARANGNHPFGALLVDAEGKVLLEAENTVQTERDCTGHAELNLMRLASRSYDPGFLATCTLYTSTEPCAMCSGAIYWGNVRRVVYALSEARLRELTGDDPANPTLELPCREVFARGQRPVEVLGPALEDEAVRVHEGFWRQ